MNPTYRARPLLAPFGTLLWDPLWDPLLDPCFGPPPKKKCQPLKNWRVARKCEPARIPSLGSPLGFPLGFPLGIPLWTSLWEPPLEPSFGAPRDPQSGSPLEVCWSASGSHFGTEKSIIWNDSLINEPADETDQKSNRRLLRRKKKRCFFPAGDQWSHATLPTCKAIFPTLALGKHRPAKLSSRLWRWATPGPAKENLYL